jgi:hypothetical protein
VDTLFLKGRFGNPVIGIVIHLAGDLQPVFPLKIPYLFCQVLGIFPGFRRLYPNGIEFHLNGFDLPRERPFLQLHLQAGAVPAWKAAMLQEVYAVS